MRQDDLTSAIRKILDQEISCTANGDGLFTSEIYADYRDTMSNEDAARILKAPDPLRAFQETLENWYFESELFYRGELEEQVIASLAAKGGLRPGGLTDEEEGQIRDIVLDLVSFEYPEDHYLKQEFCVNIIVDTGDGSYDFVLNDVYPAYCGCYGEPLDKKASIVWLAKTQGYTMPKLCKTLKAGDMKDPHGFLESMRVEVANISTHMNALTFLVRLSLRELIALNELIQYSKRCLAGHTVSKLNGYIVLDKNTGTGLYDPWNGGGSCFEIELEQDIALPVQYIRSALPDGGDGYSIERVYGMCDSAWKRGVVKDIHASKKLRVTVAGAMPA